MKILCTAPGEFAGAELKPGCYYNAEPAAEGTNAQNNAFHALALEYWVSGCHSYRAKNFLHFRELIKLYLGAGAENYYSLVDDNGRPVEKPVIRYRVKSWARYTKKERKESIDRLIAEMHQAGVQTKKFYEILRGMEDSCSGTGKLAVEAGYDGG